MVVFSSLITFAIMLLAAALSASLPQVSHNRVKCEVNPSVEEGFTYVPFPNPVGSLGLVGDVNDVAYGVVRPETVNNYWNGERTGPLGFGAGAVGPLEGGGDAVYANGLAFVRQTDNGTENYFETISGPEFRTPFAFFVLNGKERILKTLLMMDFVSKFDGMLWHRVHCRR
jgi:hypothetical protein